MNDDDEEEGEVVVARCPETNRVIECFLDWSVEAEGTSYHVLHPCDEVVAIVAFDDDGEPDMIDPDSPEMDELFATAAALFEEDDLQLMHTAAVLTLQGDLDEEEDEDWDDEEGDYEEEPYDGDAEQVEILSEFEIEDRPYSLVRMMEPVFFITKASATAEGEYVMLSDDESAAAKPFVEDSVIARGLRGRIGKAGL